MESIGAWGQLQSIFPLPPCFEVYLSLWQNTPGRLESEQSCDQHEFKGRLGYHFLTTNHGLSYIIN
jgi:hypothetical protein